MAGTIINARIGAASGVRVIIAGRRLIKAKSTLPTTIQAEDKTENFKSESFYEDDGALVVDIVIYFLRDPSTLTTKSMSVDYVDKYTIENIRIQRNKKKLITS